MNPIKEQITALFAENPGQTPADVAGKLNIPEAQVIRDMPAEMVTLLSNVPVEEVFLKLRELGDILLVMDVCGHIFEMVTPFPKGGYKFGYYNMSDRNSPMKGHLKMDNFGTIAMVAKPFHGVDTRSIQFFTKDDKPVFKVYLRRNKDKTFLAEQLEKFEEMKMLVNESQAA